MQREQGHGSEPIGPDEIKDTRSPSERAADMDRARRERMAEAEIAELRSTWDAEDKKKVPPSETAAPDKAKKDIWAEAKKELAGEVTELRGKLRSAEDEQSKAETTEATKALLAKIIEQSVRENANLGSDVVKTALALPDVKGQAFDEGLEFITDTLVNKSDYVGQLETLLKGPQEEANIVAALQKHLPERIAQIRKSAEQKIQLTRKPAPAERVADLGAKRQEKKKEDKKKAVSEAMKPFFEDVKKMTGAKKGGTAEKKKPSWWDKLTGKAA